MDCLTPALMMDFVLWKTLVCWKQKVNITWKMFLNWDSLGNNESFILFATERN